MRIGRREIRAGNFDTDEGLPLCVIFRFDDLEGGVAICCFQAFAFSGLFVERVEDARAVFFLNQTISIIHSQSGYFLFRTG